MVPPKHFDLLTVTVQDVQSHARVHCTMVGCGVLTFVLWRFVTDLQAVCCDWVVGPCQQCPLCMQGT